MSLLPTGSWKSMLMVLLAAILFASAGCAGNRDTDIWRGTTEDGSEIRIVLSRDSDGDHAFPLLYTISKNGRVILGPSTIGVLPKQQSELHIESRVFEKESIIMLFTPERPEKLLLIYDWKSKECWPDPSGGNEYAVGERLAHRIQKLTGNPRYKAGFYP